MTPDQLAKKYVTAIRVALRQHGEYTYYDKGPQEVMDIPIQELQTLSVDDIAETLRLVIEKDKKNGPRFVGTVVVSLDDWEKFDELLAKHAWLNEHY